MSAPSPPPPAFLIPYLLCLCSSSQANFALNTKASDDRLSLPEKQSPGRPQDPCTETLRRVSLFYTYVTSPCLFLAMLLVLERGRRIRHAALGLVLLSNRKPPLAGPQGLSVLCLLVLLHQVTGGTAARGANVAAKVALEVVLASYVGPLHGDGDARYAEATCYQEEEAL